MQRVGRGSSATSALWVVVVLTLTTLSILGVVGFGKAIFLEGASIFTISGVPPNPAGEVTAVAGAGISVTPDAAMNEVTFGNTGVLTVEGTAPNGAGNVAVVGGTGITVTPGVPANGLTIATPAVLTIAGTAPDGVGEFALAVGAGLSSTPGTPTNGLTLANTGVLTVAGTGPTGAGDFLVAAGSGISVTPGTPTNGLTIANTGVLSATAGSGISVSPGTTGDITISNTGVLSATAGTGISITPGTTGAITVANTGVTSLTAGLGMAISPSTGAVTASHQLTVDGNLAESSASGTHVRFTNTYGLGITASINTWYTTESSMFSTVLIPGLVPGDDGQGTSGNSWMVPIVGAYHVSADCSFQVNQDANSAYVFEMALNMGASTVDPTISGYIVPGGYSSTSFYYNAGIGILTTPLSVSGHFQAGCSGCPVAVGQFLTLHTQARVNGGTTTSYTASCRIQVSRVL